jgi:hypothetical protein
LEVKEYAMAGRTQSGSKHSANATGKSGNASGSRVREARGGHTGPKGGASGHEGGGKHPKNKIYTPPKAKGRRDRVH